MGSYFGQHIAPVSNTLDNAKSNHLCKIGKNRRFLLCHPTRPYHRDSWIIRDPACHHLRIGNTALSAHCISWHILSSSCTHCTAETELKSVCSTPLVCIRAFDKRRHLNQSTQRNDLSQNLLSSVPTLCHVRCILFHRRLVFHPQSTGVVHTVHWIHDNENALL